MRILGKLLFKLLTLIVMVVLMSSGVRYGQRYLSKGAAAMAPQIPGGDVSNHESDLMTTVFKSALRLFSGEAKREDLAAELSDKLYSGRASAGDMQELGIELVKPGGASPSPVPTPGSISPGTIPQPGTQAAKPFPGAPTAGGLLAGNASLPAAKPPVNPAANSTAISNPKQPGAPAAQPLSKQDALRAKVWEQTKRYSIELGTVPVVLFGMIVMHRRRSGRSKADDLIPAHMAVQAPSDSEPYDMINPVHSMKVEDFELLIALIYQRQGYRVSMPAALSGGRGIDFVLVRKSERILLQCKRLNQEQRVPVEKIRELQDAVTAAGATRGIYVASCGFTWDARNFAKARGMQVINARTLDELLNAAKERPDEDLMNVSVWAPKLMSKAEITTPLCPACEAPMEQITGNAEGSVWVCSQRPECKGRRSGRKHQKPAKTVASNTAESQKESIAA